MSAGGESHPGFFDIPGKVEQAINEWFAGLVKDALDPAMVLVGRTLLSTPQIAGEASVRSYWQLAVGRRGLAARARRGRRGRARDEPRDPPDVLLGQGRSAAPGVAALAVNASLALSGQMVSAANVLAGGLSATA